MHPVTWKQTKSISRCHWDGSSRRVGWWNCSLGRFPRILRVFPREDSGGFQNIFQRQTWGRRPKVCLRKILKEPSDSFRGNHLSIQRGDHQPVGGRGSHLQPEDQPHGVLCFTGVIFICYSFLYLLDLGVFGVLGAFGVGGGLCWSKAVYSKLSKVDTMPLGQRQVAVPETEKVLNILF